MKTKVFLIILLVFVSLTLISCKNVTGDEKNHQSEIQAHNIMKFDLTDFTWEIENFHCDLNVGSLENADDVIVKAMDLWTDKYGEDIDGLYEDIKEHPFHIAFDEANECWHINGVIDEDLLGAVPQALIKQDGTVLAVWIGLKQKGRGQGDGSVVSLSPLPCRSPVLLSLPCWEGGTA